MQRNRAKRLLREAARTMTWMPGIDVVVVARAACARSDLAAVRSELALLLEQLEVVTESV